MPEPKDPTPLRLEERIQPDVGTVESPLGPPEFAFIPGFGTVAIPEGEDLVDFERRVEDTINNDPELRGKQFGRMQTRMGVTNRPITGTAEERLRYFASQIDFGVGPGELEDMSLRFDLARSDDVNEKMAKLNAAVESGTLPEGTEFRTVQDFNENPVILFRRPSDIFFNQISAEGLGPGDLGSVMASVLSEEAIGEILAFTLFRGATPPGFKSVLTRGFAGAAGGELAKSGIESLRGFEFGELGDIGGKAVVSGAVSALAVGVADPILRFVNIVRGARGLIDPTPEAKGAIRAAQTEGFMDLLPGSFHPVYESLQTQASGTSLTMETAVRDRFADALSVMRNLRDSVGDLRDFDINLLTEVFERERSRILAAVQQPLVSVEGAGRKLQQGLKAFEDLSATKEALEYQAAQKASKSVQYDLSTVQDVAKALRFGTRGKIKTKKGMRTIAVSEKPQGEVKKAIDILTKLDPNVELVAVRGQEFNPLEQLIRLRSRLLNLKGSDISDEQQRMAAMLRRELSEAMLNPVSGDKKVVALWRKAATTTAFREDVMDKAFVRAAAATDTPSKLVQKFMQPFNTEQVTLLKRVLTASGPDGVRAWSSFKDGFKAELLADPGLAAGRLDSFIRDPQTLRLVLNSNEERVIRNISGEWKRLDQSIVGQLATKGAESGNILLELLDKGSRRDLFGVVEAAGGKETPGGRALKAGVIESLLNRSTRFDKGRELLDKNSFITGIETMRKRGVLDEVFNPIEVRWLRDNIETVISFLPSKMGAGESLQKAEAAAGILTPLGSGQRTIAKNRILAWIATSPRGRRILSGRGKRGTPLNIDRLRTILAVSSAVVKDMTETASGRAQQDFEASDL